ncbi:MAG: hypothetical protein KGK13_11510, partial [Rhodospirillales bacterium]|nr:hypothetical protein [Rhodospirillales bacterium]
MDHEILLRGGRGGPEVAPHHHGNVISPAPRGAGAKRQWPIAAGSASASSVSVPSVATVSRSGV